MLTVKNLEELKGREVKEGILILEAPKLEDGKYVALADVHGMLAFVQLQVRMIQG